MMPNSVQGTLDVVKYILIPIEVAFISYIMYSVIMNIRKTRQSSLEKVHPIEALRGSLDTTFNHSKMVPVLAYELSLLYYALFSWKMKPYSRSGSSSFSYHINSGALIVVLFASKLLLLEGALVHILLTQWSHMVAWLISFGNLYIILMLISEIRAMYINPILISDKGMTIRYGNQMLAEIKGETIESVSAIKFDKLSKEQLKSSFTPLFTEPNIFIQLNTPITVMGAYGVRKKVDQIYLFLDQPQEFIQKSNTIIVKQNEQ